MPAIVMEFLGFRDFKLRESARFVLIWRGPRYASRPNVPSVPGVGIGKHIGVEESVQIILLTERRLDCAFGRGVWAIIISVANAAPLHRH